MSLRGVQGACEGAFVVELLQRDKVKTVPKSVFFNLTTETRNMKISLTVCIDTHRACDIQYHSICTPVEIQCHRDYLYFTLLFYQLCLTSAAPVLDLRVLNGLFLLACRDHDTLSLWTRCWRAHAVVLHWLLSWQAVVMDTLLLCTRCHCEHAVVLHWLLSWTCRCHALGVVVIAIFTCFDESQLLPQSTGHPFIQCILILNVSWIQIASNLRMHFLGPLTIHMENVNPIKWRQTEGWLDRDFWKWLVPDAQSRQQIVLL